MRTSNQPTLSTVLTAAQARASGISSTQLTRLVRAGKLVRIGRGIYVKAEDDVSEHRSLAEARAQARKGVICLLSALRFHDLTTQAPFQVWLAIGHKDRAPQIDVTSVRIVRFSGTALTEGIEHHTIDGVDVPVYSVAKTVADCFKFRFKIGLDVALEALREALSRRKATPDEIMRFARVCRIANVIRPYLEAST
jgi:predicted transcriptional regulator of viral defense system